jgi:hypothetical protein
MLCTIALKEGSLLVTWEKVVYPEPISVNTYTILNAPEVENIQNIYLINKK